MAEVDQWLAWARELQAIAQTGLHYALSEYDTQRYTRIAELAAEITSRHTALPASQLAAEFKLEAGYKTPKIDVRAAVVRDGRILLVHEKADGLWTMPGGWADVDWPPAAMAEREAREESGYEVQVRKLVGVFNAPRPHAFFHTYKIVFLCDLLGGAPQTSIETLAVDFFDFDHLPPLSSDRTGPRHLAEVLAHVRDPARPACYE